MRLHDISRYNRIRILRHVDLFQPEPESVLENFRDIEERTQTIYDIISPYFALEYPQLSQLAPAAARNGIARWIIGKALAMQEHAENILEGSKPPGNPGPFCSMLVVLLLSKLVPNRPVFDEEVAANEISPNRLACSKYLATVPNALVTSSEDFIDEDLGGLCSLHDAAARQGITVEEVDRIKRGKLRDLVRSNRTLRENEQLIADLYRALEKPRQP
jgi:hypothetical protein